MGCCASTNKPTPSLGFHQHSSKSSRAPPPVDEELVKEVLSETTNSKHFNKIEDQPRNSIYKIQNQRINNLEENNISGDVSEICSDMSETVSATTFEEDPEVLRRKVTNRSPARLRHRQSVSGELRMTRNSTVKGKQQSPGRIRSGTIPGSETYNRGPGFGPAGRQRPVPGSGQGSRSRSPVNCMVARGGGGDGGGGTRNGQGRSPSAKRKENSPGRLGSGLSDRVLKPEPSSDLVGEGIGWGPIDRNEDELLDNPLVSLECFIFL